MAQKPPTRSLRLGQRIPVQRAAHIPLPRDFEEFFTKLVECTEYRSLVGARVRLQVPQHRIVDLEGDFTRVVIPPETYAMPGGIVTTAGIGEFERHDQPFMVGTE